MAVSAETDHLQLVIPAEQLDELELLDAMKLSEDEMCWEEKDGCAVGMMKIEVSLCEPLTVSVTLTEQMKRRLKTAPSPVTVSHLPPIRLHFALPADYPSKSKPHFHLVCNWLNFSQLSVLCKALDKLWEEEQYSVILYQWRQLLAHDTLSILSVTSELFIDMEQPFPPMVEWDKRAVQEMEHTLLVLPTLQDYDRQCSLSRFNNSMFDCCICFRRLEGAQCTQLTGCDHVHCNDCTQVHIAAKIHDGKVTCIDCPSSDCKNTIPPNIVKQLVSSSMYRRYDRLLLQQSLEGMADIVYCPRPSCRCATVKEEGEDDNMAICSSCQFSFCVLCKRTWHGVAPCKLLPDDIRELKRCYDEGDSEMKSSLEQQYGKHQLLQGFAELESKEWVATNSKPCPSCNSKIEKTHGCNKMTCSRCGDHFCWLCGKQLEHANPYRHFHSGVSQCGGRLFDGMDLDEEEFI